MPEITYSFEETKNVELEGLENYLKGLIDSPRDYNICCENIAKAGLATMHIMADEMGVTGFQASAALWHVIREWMYGDNKTGLKLVNYDDFLFPQYEDKFTTIPRSRWQKIQNEAKKNLNDVKILESTHPNVIAHWARIIAGEVPFGFTIQDD